MSGDGNINGVTYQARVIAGTLMLILAQSRLGWFSPANDVPTAVWGETDGPGDDARIRVRWSPGRERGSGQVRSVGRRRNRTQVLNRIRQMSGTEVMPVALVLDESSTSRLYRELATDLERIRSGRLDDLRSDAKRLYENPETQVLLGRLYVIRTDMDDPHDAGLDGTAPAQHGARGQESDGRGLGTSDCRRDAHLREEAAPGSRRDCSRCAQGRSCTATKQGPNRSCANSISFAS